MKQFELFNELDLSNPRFTKVWCRGCGDGWSDENFLIGKCCGYDLIYDFPMDVGDIKNELKRDEIIEAILLRASKLSW